MKKRNSRFCVRMTALVEIFNTHTVSKLYVCIFVVVCLHYVTFIAIVKLVSVLINFSSRKPTTLVCMCVQIRLCLCVYTTKYDKNSVIFSKPRELSTKYCYYTMQQFAHESDMYRKDDTLLD